jgi:chemotaxis protein methyltransferase CheR
VALLLEAIYLKYGCDLRRYSRAPLQRRLIAALAKFGVERMSDLQHRLLRDANFFSELLTCLTVQVTEMFRDPDFYLAFRQQVLPILRTYPLLRIWHAGCATGEEAYSTAILLREEGLYERTQIYATDLSAHAIAHAKQGMYHASQLPQFARNYDRSGGHTNLRHHLCEGYDGFTIRESLRSQILFFQHNLASDHTFGEMHVIFCRNVLIYLDDELRRAVLERLGASLVTGGFLCLGQSERLLEPSRRTFTAFSAMQRIYRQEEP